MTYLAPRQGLFAIIILISFLIHTTLLLISTSQQLDKLKMQTGERMLVQLIEEVKPPLLSRDKVSLSVLTGRYTSENNVASLTIKDIDNDVLLRTGQAQLLEGNTISKEVVMGDTVIGQVEMTLRDTSNGEIIASQWVFILGSFITHLLIWLVYGYVARPTRAQLAALSRDVQDYLISQRQGGQANTHPNYAIDDDDDNEGYEKETGKLSIQQALKNRIQSKTSGFGNVSQRDNSFDDFETDDDLDNELIDNGDDYAYSDNANSDYEDFELDNVAANGTDHSDDGYIDRESVSGNISEDGQGKLVAHSGAARSTKQQNALVADRPLEVGVVQIRFYDPNHLLNTLAYEKSEPYFELCTQLLQRTLDELLKQPILFGIKVKNTPKFNEEGAIVEFYGTTSHSKVGLASMMLAKAFIMLNQVAYIKHRELQRFALEVMVGVSDAATSHKLEQLIYQNANANDILTLLPIEGIKQLSGHMQLDNLKNPTTVYERDCASLEGVNDTMMQRLIDVRDAVLLSALN